MAPIVNQMTGENFETQSEYFEHVRAIEREIGKYDEAVKGLSIELKSAKESREKLVGQLRAAVREAKLQTRRGKARRAGKEKR